MGTPEISVIIPTFGRADRVVLAADSVLAQDADVEVVVVDDGSPQPIRMKRERVSVLRLAANQGAAAARNEGVAAARADWIAFLDSDDVWTANSLRVRLDAARAASDPARTIWAAGFADIWPNGMRRTRVPKPSADIADAVSACWTCPGSTALLSRDAWRRSGGQDPRLRRLEDYDWLLRWIASGGQLAVHEGVAAEIARGARASPAAINEAAVYLRKKHARLSGRLMRRMRSYLALERAAAELGARNVIGGAAALAESWLLHPRAQVELEPFWNRATGR